MNRSIKPQKKVKYLTNAWMTSSTVRLECILFEGASRKVVMAPIKGHMESSDIFLKQNKGNGPPGGENSPGRVYNL